MSGISAMVGADAKGLLRAMLGDVAAPSATHSKSLP